MLGGDTVAPSGLYASCSYSYARSGRDACDTQAYACGRVVAVSQSWADTSTAVRSRLIDARRVCSTVAVVRCTLVNIYTHTQQSTNQQISPNQSNNYYYYYCKCIDCRVTVHITNNSKESTTRNTEPMLSVSKRHNKQSRFQPPAECQQRVGLLNRQR